MENLSDRLVWKECQLLINLTWELYHWKTFQQSLMGEWNDDHAVDPNRSQPKLSQGWRVGKDSIKLFLSLSLSGILKGGVLLCLLQSTINQSIRLQSLFYVICNFACLSGANTAVGPLWLTRDSGRRRDSWRTTAGQVLCLLKET